LVSESTPPRRPVLTLDDLAPLSRRPERIHGLTSAELAVAFSQGLDLAEGKPAGHAQRVCYIAVVLADALALSPEDRAGVYFGALLHDIGVTLAASDICRVTGTDEEAIFGPAPLRSPEEMRSNLPFADLKAVIDSVHQHCILGAETVRALELPEEAAVAVLGHHERWNGAGFPFEQNGASIPLVARVVAAADMAEVVIASEHSSLIARKRFAQMIGYHAGESLDPQIVSTLLAVSRDDGFWLGLYGDDLAETLNARRPGLDQRTSRKRVLRFSEVFADIADAKGGHTVAHSRHTADAVQKLAQALELDESHTEMIRISALLHDIGLLGVPARIMSKPDILSVTEMQLMRQHPAHSEMILRSLQGFEEVAFWISRHHERPDGKGYPDMLTGDEIPLESRILAVADVYSALIAERPHRGALGSHDARQILLGAAGTQLDAELVRAFVELI
jgi:HD-GYP domain-containing protein (c-di-GMP phosphodiesterase class II)